MKDEANTEHRAAITSHIDRSVDHRGRESNDETILENFKHLFKQLRQLKMLQGSMLKLVSADDTFADEKSFKDRKSDTTNKVKETLTKESLSQRRAETSKTEAQLAPIIVAAQAAGLEPFS